MNRLIVGAFVLALMLPTVARAQQWEQRASKTQRPLTIRELQAQSFRKIIRERFQNICTVFDGAAKEKTYLAVDRWEMPRACITRNGTVIMKIDPTFDSGLSNEEFFYDWCLANPIPTCGGLSDE